MTTKNDPRTQRAARPGRVAKAAKALRPRAVKMWVEDLDYATRLGERTEAYPRQVLRDAVAKLHYERVTVPRALGMRKTAKPAKLAGLRRDLSHCICRMPAGDGARAVSVTLEPGTLLALQELEERTGLKRRMLLRMAMMAHWNWADYVRNPRGNPARVPALDLGDLLANCPLNYGGF